LPISQARIIQPTADIMVAALLFIDSALMLKLRLRGNSHHDIWRSLPSFVCIMACTRYHAA
jgi:hypothetical protein